jgi:hypothetical protein
LISNSFQLQTTGSKSADLPAAPISTAVSPAPPSIPAAAPSASTITPAPSSAAPAKSAAPTSATESTSAAAAGAGFTGFGFVDDEGPAAELLAVAGCDCFAGFFVVGHLDETEAARAAGFAIDDDRGRRHGSEGSELRAEFVFGAAEGQIADVNPHTVSRILPKHPSLTMKPTRRSGRIRNGPKTTRFRQSNGCNPSKV